MRSEAELLARAKALRRHPAAPEVRLWRSLSHRQLGGLEFRRQPVVVEAQAMLDLFCPALALVIEVDGDSHDDAGGDSRRAARLTKPDFRVLGVPNIDVMMNIEGVTAAAAGTPRWLSSLLPHPNSSPDGEGLRK